jgi:hypothetical protein
MIMLAAPIDLDPLQARQLCPGAAALAGGDPVDIGGHQVEERQRGEFGGWQFPSQTHSTQRSRRIGEQSSKG